MSTAIFIEKLERDQCFNCKLYKKPVKGRKDKFEVVCQENMRLKSMILHRDITLNYIDRKAGTCSGFRRAFEGAK